MTLELDNVIQTLNFNLHSIRIDKDSMETINNLPNGYLIIDIVYGGEGDST